MVLHACVTIPHRKLRVPLLNFPDHLVNYALTHRLNAITLVSWML